MTTLAELSTAELAKRLDEARRDYEAFKAQGLKLDMTRGKPSPEQLDLASGMLALPGNRDHTTAAGEDARNYGGVQGLPEARALFAPTLGAPIEQIALGENSSLALMHDCIVWALLKGVPGSARPWVEEKGVAFLCPVPGYDRHFALCEEFGIRMIPVLMTGHGPDMDEVERLVADPSVKGMWCVPRYSNPSGETYSDETVRRLAAMKTGAADFRLFWDDAYAVHHLNGTPHGIANILEESAGAGHPDRAFIFASTSKVSLAGAGISAFASSPANLRWFLSRAGKRSIGPDKLNELRHAHFFRDPDGVARHMEAHRAILQPKFEAVLTALEATLGGTGVAQWTKPEGGYFITLDVLDGTAAHVVTLAKEAGLALTPAGATWPGGHDPHDRTLRLAPSYPKLAEVKNAARGIAACVLLAALEKLAADRNARSRAA